MSNTRHVAGSLGLAVGIFSSLRFTYITPDVDEALWHKCRSPFFPRRTVDGGWTDFVGQVWRRRRPDGKWEYRQDEESYDDWIIRQW